MSANDQRPKGQPSQVSNGSKEEDAYLQQPPHPMRAWSEQASDGAYGAGPMSTAVSDSFFPNYYPPNMSYPFMSQGMGGSEGAWSSGADTMFGMGYDYPNMYSGFGFPFNNWDYSGDYWGSSQQVRKDQRGYPAEDAYYPQEMIPADSYGMVNGGAPPPEPQQQQPVDNVEQGIRNMHLAYRKDDRMPPPPQQQHPPPPPPQQQHQQQHLHQVVAEGFGGGDPSMMMPLSPVSVSAPSMGVGNSGGDLGQGSGGSGQSSKKTSWAAIASQPARAQIQMRSRTIPRAPVHPGKSHNMDIGTWDMRGGPSRVPMTMSQPLPSQPPPPLSRSSRPPLISHRQPPMQPSSANVVISNSTNNNNNSSSGGSAAASNINSSSGYRATVDGSGSNHSGGNLSNSDNTGVVAADSNNSNSMAGVGGNSSAYSCYGSGNSDSNRPVVTINATVNGTHGEPQAKAVAVDSNSEKSQPIVFENPKEFVLNHKSARYFIIKSYSEDDIHRSIKYAVWCSTDHGNRRLDAAFREREGKGPVYLIYSVNGSGHFCGVAQMMTPVDMGKNSGIWHQDKWKGQIEVKWVYVKDVPNSQLRHIRLENNDNKPVTNSRDTQEVPPEKGKQVLRIMHSYKNTTSIFDDFSHYEKRQEEDRILTTHKEHRGGGDRGDRGDRGNRGDYHGGQRDNRGGDRDNYHRGGGGDRGHGNNDHHYNNRNDYNRDGGRDNREQRYDNRGDNRNDNRGDNRNDNRDRQNQNRGGFDREIRGRPGDINDRENRRGGGHRQN